MPTVSRKTASQLVEELYRGKRRKGIDKDAVEHLHDVVEFCFLDQERDNIRTMHLLNAALLHDVVEDFAQDSYTLEHVQALIGLSTEETRLLDLLTRKKGQEEKYLPGICAEEDAVRIKLADRIANCRDLAAWVTKDRCFCEEARGIHENYKRENAAILAMLHQHFAAELADPSHVFSRQLKLLDRCMQELERFYAQYQGAALEV